MLMLIFQRFYAHLPAVETLVDRASSVPRGVRLSSFQPHEPGDQPFQSRPLPVLRVVAPTTVAIAATLAPIDILPLAAVRLVASPPPPPPPPPPLLPPAPFRAATCCRRKWAHCGLLCSSSSFSLTVPTLVISNATCGRTDTNPRRKTRLIKKTAGHSMSECNVQLHTREKQAADTFHEQQLDEICRSYNKSKTECHHRPR